MLYSGCFVLVHFYTGKSGAACFDTPTQALPKPNGLTIDY